MTAAQIIPGRFSPWAVFTLRRTDFRRECSQIARQTQVTLLSARATFGVENLSTPKGPYAGRVGLLDQFPEESNHRGIAEREDDRSHIGKAQKVHHGMSDPQPEEGHCPEGRRRIGLAGQMYG